MSYLIYKLSNNDNIAYEINSILTELVDNTIDDEVLVECPINVGIECEIEPNLETQI
jgi:hypothetical protein